MLAIRRRLLHPSTVIMEKTYNYGKAAETAELQNNLCRRLLREQFMRLTRETSYETTSHTERSEITEVWVYNRLRRKKNVLCGLCEL
jgi:hypothetical protein